MTALLVADCVTKSYGERRVLTSGTMRAVSGELRVLLGRNGAGKSTLLKIAAGWIAPDSGAVRFDGVVYPSARLATLATLGVFYLPDHDLLTPTLSVRRQLNLFRRRFDGLDPNECAERMGLGGLLDRSPNELSGGELRRAEVTAALVRRPRCLLADEPYRGVAPLDAEVLTHAFQTLASEGCAVVITGHEVPTLLAAADHVTWCTSGTTHELGAPDVARVHDQFRREYLGTR